jgi:hypothetical protein
MSWTFEAPTSVEQKITDRIVQGRNVEYQKVLDRIKIVKTKG